MKHLRMWSLILWGAGAACTLSAAAETPRLASAFGHHMVLQRDAPVPVWGTAEPGSRVEVLFANRRTQTTADAQGRWMARIGPLAASDQGSTLSVRDAKGEGEEITDVLVGDVWLCSGQSNMRWTVAKSEGAAEMIASADIPTLRLLNWRDYAKQPVGLDPSGYFKGTWACASPDVVRDFSAVAFSFGRELTRHSKVPVGLILNAVGGSPMISWLPESVVASRPEYAVPEGELPFMTPALRGWVLMAIRRDAKVTAATTAANCPSHPYQPSYLYHAGIEPLRPMSLKGVIWYQGESDAEHEDPLVASLLLRDLVHSWRSVFQSPRLPFLMVQLPRIESPDRVHWPIFREAQRRAMHDIPGVYAAVTMDMGVYGSNVHPPRKIPVGERLARIARNRVYGERVPAFGPDVASAHAEGSSMRVTFEHADGLRSSDDAPLRGFELAGRDGVFQPAHAVIEGATVIVSTERVAQPVSVRYGWHMNADLNLANRDGLPAYPFAASLRQR